MYEAEYMQDIWTKYAGDMDQMQCCNVNGCKTKNIVSDLPPPEESAYHGLRQIVIIMSSSELSRHLPTPTPGLHPATGPTRTRGQCYTQ